MTDVLIDTCILVDVLRKNPKAKEYLETLSGTIFVSSLTCAELRAGSKDDQEKERINIALNSTQVIPVSEAIANHGGDIRKQYKNSHGVGLIDALIAAHRLF